jgi:hypothetical protein
MDDNDGLLDEFLAEANDKYYPQVMEGLAQLQQGLIAEGVETLSRPLHTIKGVTGFIPGFEPASSFTHEVESFLKKLQSQEVPDTPDTRAVAARAVTAVFTVIDQIKQHGAPSPEETEDVRQALRRSQKKQPHPDAGNALEMDVEERPGCRIFRPKLARIHLAAQRQALIETLGACPPGSAILLDFSRVTSMGSALWEDILPLAAILDLGVTGLSGHCRAVLHAWGFDCGLTQWPSAEAFLAERS